MLSHENLGSLLVQVFSQRMVRGCKNVKVSCKHFSNVILLLIFWNAQIIFYTCNAITNKNLEYTNINISHY